jgi:hypothetical protein
MPEAALGECDQLVRQIARYAAGVIAVGLKMVLLRGEKIGRDRPSAGIVEFLRVRFRLALHGTDVAEIGVGPVGPMDPKVRCRVSLSGVSASEKVLDTGSDLCRAVGDDGIVALKEGNQIIMIRAIFHDLVVRMAGKHILEMG